MGLGKEEGETGWDVMYEKKIKQTQYFKNK